MIKVPYNYLPMQFSNPEPFIEDWKELIKTADFTLGSYVKKFEDQFAEYVKAKYCIATNNGTDALILSLKALGIGVGDEVITVCNSFYATTGAIVAVGATPIFVDCDHRYQIDISAIESAITPQTKAILPVHWAGASPNMTLIMGIAKKYSLKVIEDACMGIGGKYAGKSPGTFGDCGAYSMHPLKSLNVMGDGGMVTTDDFGIYSWMLKYRNHGMVDRDHIDMWGVNMRIQPLQAIVAMRCLPKLNEVIAIRDSNAKKLDQLLSVTELKPYVSIPARDPLNKETHALYMGLFRDRDRLKGYLDESGIEVKIHYPLPLHLQKAARVYGYEKGSFKVAEQQAGELLTIPIHQFINDDQISYIAQKIKDFYKRQ
jgi:aminotransferase EvaB